MNSQAASKEQVINILSSLPKSELELFEKNPWSPSDRTEKATVQYFNFFKDLVTGQNTQSTVPRAFNLRLQMVSAIYLERFGRSEDSQKIVSKIHNKYNDELRSIEEDLPQLAVIFRTLALLHAQKTNVTHLATIFNDVDCEVTRNNVALLNAKNSSSLMAHLGFDNTISDKSFQSIDDFEFVEKPPRDVSDVPEIFSICTSIHKIGPNLGHALMSLRVQSFQAFRCYLVLDTQDKSVADYAKKFAATDPRFLVLEKHHNLGTYNSRNIVLNQCSGAYFMAHDSDDILKRDYLETVINITAKRNYVGVIANGLRIGPDGILSSPDYRGSFERLAYPTFCFKRAEVINRIGFYKEWQHSADSEFQNRTRKIFGKNRVPNVKTTALLQRDDTENLTAVYSTGLMGFGVEKSRRLQLNRFLSNRQSKGGG